MTSFEWHASDEETKLMQVKTQGPSSSAAAGPRFTRPNRLQASKAKKTTSQDMVDMVEEH